MNSEQLGRYIDETNGMSKPWLLVQLRLKKLQERREDITQEAYLEALADIHQDMMKLGEWWIGQEREVFGHDA